MPPLNRFTKSCLTLAIGKALLTPAHAAEIVVNNAGDISGDDDQCTLREAIISANTSGGGTSGCVGGGVGQDTITFAGQALNDGYIRLDNNGTLAISDDLEINAPANVELFRIYGDSNSRVFTINNAQASFNGISIKYGQGGVLVDNSTLNLNNSSIASNYAATDAPGGGIHASNSSLVNIDQSTIKNNYAGQDSVGGGGLYVDDSTINITNSTVRNNIVSEIGTISGRGGGIYAYNSTVAITNSTVARNTAVSAGGIYASQGGVITLQNSLITGNRTYYGSSTSGREIYNNSSIITADANNLFADANHTDAEAFVGFTPGASDINASSDGASVPLSGIISKYSGNDHLPLTPTSPAVDAGNNATCAAAPVNGVDQLGEPRDDAVCDIGAFELRDVNFTIDDLGDDPNSLSCNLRNAILSVNNSTANGGCPAGKANNTFQLSYFSTYGVESDTITLLNPLPQITGDIDFSARDGFELVIDANNTGRVLNISGAKVDLKNITLRGGSIAGAGGGINAVNSTLNLDAITVAGNLATAGTGGGINANGTTLNIINSTLTGNYSSSFGGGFYTAGSMVSITNSTLSGNAAVSDGGAADVGASTLIMINSTVSSNSAINGFGGGIDAFSYSTLALANTIVSGNSAGGGGNSGGEISDFDGNSTINFNAYNLFGYAGLNDYLAFRNVTPGGNDLNATSDGLNIAISSILNPLNDNGGQTATHALPAGSPALGAAESSSCLESPVGALDQRGLLRTAYCDIGAFELQQTATITVNSALDTTGNPGVCTLRDAINASRYNQPFGGCPYGDSYEIIEFDSAAFPANANNRITLNSSLPLIKDTTLTMNGVGTSGLTIDANQTGYGLLINDSTVTLNRINITNASSGGIQSNYSSLTLNSSSVSNNSTTGSAAGIGVYRGSLIVNQSTIRGNSTGLTYAYGYTYTGAGGGIYARYAELLLTNSTVSGNSATDSGGGLDVFGSTVTLTNSTVSGNTAATKGGGLYGNLYGSVSFVNSLVTGNRAADGAEIATPSGFGTTAFSSNNSLFGDSASNNAQAFTNFTPAAADINATRNGINARLTNILKSLAANGGPTLTHALAENSPALDAASNTNCGVGKMIAIDQRGEPRNDGLCDIGSFEGFVADEVQFFVVPLPNGKSVIFSL